MPIAASNEGCARPIQLLQALAVEQVTLRTGLWPLRSRLAQNRRPVVAHHRRQREQIECQVAETVCPFAQREQGPAVVAASAEIRHHAFSLFVSAYDRCQR